MDEQKLAELFQSAVRDTPPASFNEHDVAWAADRITRRRRSMVAGGGLAVVILAVGLFLGTSNFVHTLGGSSSSAAAGGLAQSDAGRSRLVMGPENAPPGPRSQRKTGFPMTTPMQGSVITGEVGSVAGSASQGCGPTDAELAVALANELSSVGASTLSSAATSGSDHLAFSCPAGSRLVTAVVRDGTAAGGVAVVLVPRALYSSTVSSWFHVPGPSASGAWEVVVLTQPSLRWTSRVADIEKAIAAKF